METPTDRQRVDDNPRTRHEFTRKYGGLFASDITFRERLEQVRADLPNRFVDYPDDHFLGKDVKTLTKDFMFRLGDIYLIRQISMSGSGRWAWPSIAAGTAKLGMALFVIL